MARVFLADVARSLGRGELDCPFISKLVSEEWLDTVEDLQSISPQRWEAFRLEYRIPARFVDATVDALHRGTATTTIISPASKAPVGAAISPASKAPVGAAISPASEALVGAAAGGDDRVIPASHPRPRPWASRPRLITTALECFWQAKRGITPALERVLLSDQNVRTYGILGKTLDQATLSGVAEFAKAAWIGVKSSNTEPVSQELSEDLQALRILSKVEAPMPTTGDRYGAVLLMGDCSLEELRTRLFFAADLWRQGALGENPGFQVCAAVSPAEPGGEVEEDRSANVRTAVTEILGADAARVLSIRVVPCPSQAESLYRAWLRVAPEADIGSPLLVISSQPYALWHQLVLDKVLRETKDRSTQWPPWLAHVASPESSPKLPFATVLDAVGRVLVEMDAKNSPRRKRQAATPSVARL